MATLNNLEQELAALRAENERLKAATTAKIRLKLGEKGTVVLYIPGTRFPVSLYASQWETILPFLKSGAVETFIAEHASEVARKAA